MNLQRISRYCVLGVAGNRAVSRLAHRYGLSWGVLRFIAGTTMEDGLRVAKALNAGGLAVTMSNLGEAVKTREQAEADSRLYQTLLAEYGTRSIDGHISVKVTRLGLDVDRAWCVRNLERLVETAGRVGSFVRINMEELPRVQPTLEIFREVAGRLGTGHVGVAIQAGLRRSEADLRDLARLGASVRIVKGSFNESPRVMFTRKADVDESFFRLARFSLEHGGYTAIATHDERLVNRIKAWVRDRRVDPRRFEWQMLYGIRRDMQAGLAAEGYTVRVYLPFGPEWYAYFSRRLAERPANLLFVLKHIVRP